MPKTTEKRVAIGRETKSAGVPTTRKAHEEIRTGTSAGTLKQAVLDNLYHVQARIPELATQNDWYMAVAYTVRHLMLERFIRALKGLRRPDAKIACYLSAEFLMGPHLGNNLLNLGITGQMREAVKELGLNLDELLLQEEEPGLGNGGLGRLAACYMDSLASLSVPAIGYGIRYEFGIFDQEIRDGWQVEKTDKWLRLGNPWEICEPEISYYVNFGGHTEQYRDEKGRFRVRWVPHRVVKGIAYDTAVPAYRDDMVGMLRLWKSEAVESFDFQEFNIGHYYKAVEAKVISETVSKVLYPNDEPEIGKTLRLAQQYFFVSCSLQDMIRIHQLRGQRIETFHESFAIQLNDTHPSIAVAELMRLLVDEHLMDWDRAWKITQQTMAYTNHTLLPEALEKWPLQLFSQSLPRHLEIIYEINRRFLDEVRLRYPGDDGLIARLSLIDESGERHVRMAHLASVGSHCINGVAALHSDLLTKTVLKDLYDLYPDRFVNITNGVTPRRWVALSNPGLTGLLTRTIGDRWIKHFEDEIRRIEPFADDSSFRSEWEVIKRDNKSRLAALIKERTGVAADPDSLFDIQVKRIHEYKRQHLNVLHIITLYNRIKKDPKQDIIPRTFIFGGKAAPGYFMAKLIIKLINSVAEVVNNDRDVAGRLKVVFFPDFNVKNAHHIYPAADLSEQISTAGKEASGTGNMKFAMNGALTIGTLDGANVEIREEVGPENFFLFGLTAGEVEDLWGRGYNPRSYYESNPNLREAIDQIASGCFSWGDRELFRPLVENLMNHDPFLLLADYQSYVDCQDRVSAAYRNRDNWVGMSVLNVARMGRFSSDRSIREYCEHIWQIKPVEGDGRRAKKR
ncbi:MAG TPA: glycogen/starch/alpha-glucan phosphorylase [Thermodesulfovibrionales bacterium]|nr:glycogen/starch/alpha-glucan phosphorylase [Thermodesulfovibrionales bacterium]